MIRATILITLLTTAGLAKEPQIIGKYWLSVWELSDGRQQEQLLTEKEYYDLQKPNAGSPPNRTGDPKAKWKYAFEAIKHDTDTWDQAQ